MSDAALDSTFLAAQRSARLRGRVLPLIGAAVLLFLWWAVVAVFHVRPFIAPSPEVVAALAPFARALAARAVALPAAAASGRLATNLNSLIGAVEAARLRVNASSRE